MWWNAMQALAGKGNRSKSLLISESRNSSAKSFLAGVISPLHMVLNLNRVMVLRLLGLPLQYKS
jgi:hypothetical protein